MKNKIASTNYSAHAIEDLKKTAQIFKVNAPKTAKAHELIIGMLEDSVKFLLPDGGELLEPEKINQGHLDLTRLPYPCIALEAPFLKNDNIEYVGEFRQYRSSKRIALCWEVSEDYDPLVGLAEYILQHFKQGGICVLPIFWTNDVGQWSALSGGGFFPYNNKVMESGLKNPMPVSQIANQALDEAGLIAKKGITFKSEPFVLFPEVFEHSVSELGSSDKAFAQIVLDSRDEISMLIQTCSVLNCANVKTEDIPPPTALNKKRIAKGKQPFFSYKVLQVNDATSEPQGGAVSGSQSSPRMHLRRGHIRRLENKTIWVRPSVINAKSKIGSIQKDYSLSVVN